MNADKENFIKSIKKGTDNLDNLSSIKILDEWQWFDYEKKWSARFQISIRSPNTSLIPNKTDWYILVESSYPRGTIDIAPAKENGIDNTFQHQYYNSFGNYYTTTWRTGNICPQTEMYWFHKDSYDIEPFEPEIRLKWYIKRVFKWLYCAATGNLAKEGTPFELPDYNTSDKTYTIAFCECQETLNIWAPLCNGIQMGVVELGLLGNHNTLVTLAFKNQKNQILYKPNWNKYIVNQIQKTVTGTWILVPRTLVLPPWQAPMTWGELMDAVGIIGEHYDKLDEYSPFVLIGFLIPKRIGQMPDQIHWQALYLPVIKKSGSLLRYLDVIHSSVDWQKSENWHPNEIFNRGMYSMNITDSKTLIIGGGAFGSMVAEMLVRGGAKEIVLVDHEKIEIGNLTRHTLNLKDIGVDKAKAMEKHLTNISPHVRVKGIIRKFENANEKHINEFKNANIVIDCSGSDDILHYIEQFPWENRPLYFSISIGLNAKRLYVLVSKRSKFPRVFFQGRMKKWLYKDVEEYGEADLPRSGGIGCWHPAFPARCDEMWLWAATALKYFIGYTQSNLECTKVAIFEQEQIGNFFGGIKLVEEYHDR